VECIEFLAVGYGKHVVTGGRIQFRKGEIEVREAYANGDGSTNSAMRRGLCAHSLAFCSSSLSCAEATTIVSPLLNVASSPVALSWRDSGAADDDPGPAPSSDQNDENRLSKPEFVLGEQLSRGADSVRLELAYPSTGNRFKQLLLLLLLSASALPCRIPRGAADTFGGLHDPLDVDISDFASRTTVV